MPNLTRRRHARRGGRRRRRANIYGTKASFMPKSVALKRYGNVSTKTFWFKASGSLNSDVDGNTTSLWTTRALPVNPGDPFRMPNVADSYTVAECYTEFKVLAIKVVLFAANVGNETGMINPGANVPGYNRGNTVVYLDQDIRLNEPTQTDILDVINFGSSRMIPSRVDKWTTTIYRKKGEPGWGCCDRNVPVTDREPDPWFGSINLLGNNARPAVRPLWFYTVCYKIIFRGRNFAT